MAEYERIGGGRYDVYRKKPPEADAGTALGCLFWVFILLVVLGAFTGCSVRGERTVKIERGAVSNAETPTMSGTAQRLLNGDDSDDEKVEVVRQREYRTKRGGSIRYEYRVTRSQE